MQEALRAYNLTHEQAVDHLRSVLKQSTDLIGNVRIRCVSTESNGEWHNAICVIDLVENDQSPHRKASLRYPRIHLLEERVNSFTFLTATLDAVSKGIIPVDGESVSTNVNTRFNEWEFLPSNNNFSKYPGHIYKTPYVQQPQLAHHEPLLAYDLPFFPNPYFAIREWMGFRLFHMDRDASLGTIQVFLPQSWAYLKSLMIDKNILKISATNAQSLKLRLKGAWEHDNGCSPFEALVTGPEALLQVPDHVEGFEVYLMGPDETVYDFHRETKLWTLGQERVLGAVPGGEGNSTIAQKAIGQGEGETVEFKPYIKESGSKLNELVKTVIAFANTKGGVLLVGISDDCVPEGVEREISKEAFKNSSTPEDQLTKYMGWLRQSVAGELNRNLNLSVSPAVIDGHTIILLSIPEGDQKPYANVKSNSIYIRRGANNVIPHPDHELPEIMRARTDVPFV